MNDKCPCDTPCMEYRISGEVACKECMEDAAEEEYEAENEEDY